MRAGDASLHRNWLAGGKQRTFDLLVSYYGSVPGRFAEEADIYHAMAGTRWAGHADIFRSNPSLCDAYDRVCLACDDLDAEAPTWNELFRCCRDYKLDLAQPAIVGPVSFSMTAPVDDVAYRLTSFVEIMCPVFSRRALALCRPTFGESLSGWGLDAVWPKILSQVGGRLGILDTVRVAHTRPMREGSLYPLLDRLGIDPHAEAANLMARYGVETLEIHEIARFPKPRRWGRLRST